jgi:subtilisin family serine protease
MRIYTAILILIVLPYSLSYSDNVSISELPNGARYISDKIVVSKTIDSPGLEVYVSDGEVAVTGITSIDRICRQYRISTVEPFYPYPLRNEILARKMSRIYVFTIKDKSDLVSAIDDLSTDPHIKYAEYYTVPEPQYTPNDPWYYQQWYLPHVQAPEAWDIIRGDTTRHSIIAVVDAGVNWWNPDITPNIWVNEPEDLNGNNILDVDDLNGLDDDGNGYVDDVVGWDHGSADNDPSEDALIHGTSVASCASPATDNGIGIAGLGFSARIMCVKAADQNGNFMAPYPCMLYSSDNGAHVINCSWATPQYSQFEQDVINVIYDAGSLIIASASATMDTIPAYPCGYDNVMAVTATDDQDHKAYFADFGFWVDVCAPGVNIFVIGGSGHSYMTGTSFSAGIVSGLAGLVRANFPDYTNAEIEEVIEDGCINIDSLNPYYAGMLGAGRINAYNSVSVTGIESEQELPESYVTIKAYPNPFNSVCKISVTGPAIHQVKIYDITGRLVERLELNRGEAVWDGSAHTSGVYFARGDAGEISGNLKLILLK